MTTQNIFYATPDGSAMTGFIFTDLDSYKAEYDHRHCLFGTEEYELQMVDGNYIDLELFAGLQITQSNIAEWFLEIQHLTNEEKVGLWFLVQEVELSLIQALESLQDGLTIYHGTKNKLAGLLWKQNLIPDQNADSYIHEFRFVGQTWCANPRTY